MTEQRGWLAHRDAAATHPRRTSFHARWRDERDDLPAEAAAAIQRMRAGEPPPGHHLATDMAARLPLDHYLLALWRADWPIQALCRAYGTRQRQTIHNRLGRARVTPLAAGSRMPPVPEAPERPGAHATRDPRPARPPRPEIPAAVAARLRALQAQARRVNGSTPAGHPDRAASESLSAAMAELRTAGHTYQEIADATGIRKDDVWARLARHGYIPTPASVAGYAGNRPQGAT